MITDLNMRLSNINHNIQKKDHEFDIQEQKSGTALEAYKQQYESRINSM